MHTNLPMYVPWTYLCTYLAYIPMYICTHGEVQNANGWWSATCGCLQYRVYVYVHTYSHVQMVTNKIMEKKLANCQNFSTFHWKDMYVCNEKMHMYVEEYQDHAVEIHTVAMNVLLGRCDPPHWTYFFYNSRKPIYLHMYTWRSAKCKRLLVSNVACQQHAAACQQHRVYMYIHIHMYKWSPTKVWKKQVGKLSVFFHISPYSTCICYFIAKTCMHAMKKCIEEYQDHAVEIHTFAMNVLLGQLQKRAWQVHNNALESYTWNAKCKRLLVSNTGDICTYTFVHPNIHT